MIYIIKDFEFLAFSKTLCFDCRKKFDALLDGRTNEILLCKKCQKAFEDMKKQQEGQE